MSNLIEQITGGRRGEFEDFVGRVEQGEPHEGFSEDEARSRHDELAAHLSDDDYELSAQQAFERLAPDQRREFARMLRSQARNRNVGLGEFGEDDDERDGDPRHLGRMARHARRSEPNLLGGLLGGAGGMTSNPIAKAALGGITAMAAKRFLGR